MADFDMDVTSDVDDTPSSDMSDYITDAADNLPDPSFPYKLKCMDLTMLHLPHLMRVPSLMLIRDEWVTLSGVLEARRPNLLGSVVITGQPGIGQ
jgi:hypothetical protein